MRATILNRNDVGHKEMWFNFFQIVGEGKPGQVLITNDVASPSWGWNCEPTRPKEDHAHRR